MEKLPNEDKNGKDVEKSIFGKEIKMMMFGYGDETPHYIESINILDKVVCDYIKEITVAAASVKRGEKISPDDLLNLFRKDKRKYKRGKDLLSMNEEIKRAKKAFDFDSIMDADV